MLMDRMCMYVREKGVRGDSEVPSLRHRCMGRPEGGADFIRGGRNSVWGMSSLR